MNVPLEQSIATSRALRPPKRLAALAAGVLLCVSALAGCGGGDDGTDAAGTAASPSDTGISSDRTESASVGVDFTSTNAVPPADVELFDGTPFAAAYAAVADPEGARVSIDCTDQLAGVAGKSVLSATCDFYGTKAGSFMISTPIVTGPDSETWIRCPNSSGGYGPQARLRGSQYGQTKVFDADA